MAFLPTGPRIVPPEGNSDAKICIIGEAPGAVEERLLRPFVGPTRGILEQCLHAAGLIRIECYLTNIFKFRITKTGGGVIKHPDGTILWHPTKGYTQDAQPYLDELKEELDQCASHVFVPMGNLALEALCGKKGIYKWRGSILPSTLCNERKTIPTIHPAAVLQSGDYLARYLIIFDLKRVREESDSPIIFTIPQNLAVDPSFLDARTQLGLFKKWGIVGKRINFDIEVVNQEISCISFSTSINFAVSIPFHNKWIEEEEIILWQDVADIIGDEDIRKCNQNILFDALILATKNNITIKGRLDDPMVAHHIMYPDFKKDLGLLTSLYTSIPYYKDEGKVWFKGISSDIKEFWRYNAQDSAASIECMDRLDIELDKQEYRDAYEHTLDLYYPLLAMMVRGIKADRGQLAEAKKLAEKQQREKQVELDELVGYELNVNSSKQCQQYFYIEKKIRPYLNRKTRKVTTDDAAMARIAKGTANRLGLREGRLVQEIRAHRKLISTYLDIDLDTDSRIRCSFNPRGTTTGRLSSSKTIFGSGGNLQNLPLEFKRFLVADDGYLLIEIDKAQAEWIVVAYMSGDARMIEVIEKQLDPHMRTGELVTRIPLVYILSEDIVLGHETDPAILNTRRKEELPELLDYVESHVCFLPRTMTIRQAGKKCNHGLNYGMGYRTFALVNEIPEKESKEMVEGYHAAYPGVRQGFHADIERQLSKDRVVTNCFAVNRRFLGMWGTQLLNQAYDYPAQSTVACLINRGLSAIYKDQAPSMKPLELLSQTHDSILMQYPTKDLERMADAIKRCVRHLDPEMTYKGRTFHIDSDIKIGFNWRDMKEVYQNLSDLVEVCGGLGDVQNT